MTNNSNIITNSGIVVPELVPDYNHFIDKTTAIFGPSKTGKTVIIKNILYLLKDHIEQIVVVSPSESSNGSYKGIVPAPLIHYNITSSKSSKKDSKSTDLLNSLWQRQNAIAGTYNLANEIPSLKKLYRRISSSEGDAHINKIKQWEQDAKIKISKQYVANIGKRDEQIKAITENSTQMLQALYKKYIGDNYKRIKKMKDLDENEKYSLKYLKLNPRMVLILDDCAAQIKKMMNSDIMRMLFYQNRHGFITFIICCQDDTDLPSNLRKNAFSSFFTNDVVTSANFTRTSNQFSKDIKKYVEEISPVVFSEENRKLVYIREDKQHFYHIKFPIPPAFKFGSNAVNELCKNVESDGLAVDEDNPYTRHFKI